MKMADPKNPNVGDCVFDGSEFAPYLVDVPPGGLQGMRKAQDGCEEVIKEILANQAEWGSKAGITPDDAANLEDINTKLARLEQFVQPVRKFLELLVETRYVLDDRKQKLIYTIAQGVDRRGREKPELLAKYQHTRAYRSAIAKKGVKTRNKNAEEASAPEGSHTSGPAPDQILPA
jgi:hypothetical protein